MELRDTLINLHLDHRAVDWHQDKANVLLAFEGLMGAVSEKCGDRQFFAVMKRTRKCLLSEIKVNWKE